MTRFLTSTAKVAAVRVAAVADEKGATTGRSQRRWQRGRSEKEYDDVPSVMPPSTSYRSTAWMVSLVCLFIPL